ncbi:MAG: alpha/beta hydrolase, partial [Oscillospiraceae bacterium]|nr:alpha/beta hydrolase [Oscillospiraceae bacterium]
MLLLAVCGINHNLQLKREAQLLNPMGMVVKVNGHTMHIYTEGEGDHAIVFLSGGGTCSPVLDFKSLYSRLTEDHLIVVVEKAGYGFSEDADV